MLRRWSVVRAAVLVAPIVVAILGLVPAPQKTAAATTRGGCPQSSPTCYFFDLSMSGTGFGTYATIDENSQFSGRIVCHYGNETQTGVCGWGYEVSSPGGEYGVVYKLTPDAGSQVCDTQHCYGGVVDDVLFITGNYGEARWRFELIDHVQIDVETKGPGKGSVTSDPAGISCPDDCDDLFAQLLPVKLTAKAASGSVFAGWSGACSGTNPVCTITTDFLVTATATFNKKATPAPPTEEPTDEATPTDEPPTAEPTAAPTAEPTAAPTEAPPVATAVPGPTADPSTTGSAGGGNLPIVIGLGVVLLVLVGGAAVAFRRGGGVGGT